MCYKTFSQQYSLHGIRRAQFSKYNLPHIFLFSLVKGRASFLNIKRKISLTNGQVEGKIICLPYFLLINTNVLQAK